MYKVIYQVYQVSVGKDYQVVKRGMKYHGFGVESNVDKRERGSNIIFPIIFRLLGRISSGEENGNFGEENQDLKIWEWGRISCCRKLYTPLFYRQSITFMNLGPITAAF